MDILGRHRSRLTFHRLLRTKKFDDGRVWLDYLGAQLSKNPAALAGATASLERYRRGNRIPEPSFAWQIGERLRECGVPWSSGVFMLIACGHIGDAIAVTSLWLMEQTDPRPHLGDAWHMIALGPRLCRHNALDRLREYRKWHVRTPRFDAARASELLLHEPIDLMAQMKEPDLILRDDLIAFVEREMAKDAWTHYAKRAQRFDQIAQMWFARKKGQVITNMHFIVRGALKIAEAGDAALEDREFPAIGAYAHFLKTIKMQAEIGEPYFGIEARPYPLPIEKKYWVDETTSSEE